jgi:hypothetical protein
MAQIADHKFAISMMLLSSKNGTAVDSLLTTKSESLIYLIVSQEAMMPDGLDEDFALKLVGDGISIDKKVSKQIALAVVAAVLSDGTAATSAERLGAADRSRAKPALSLREFLTESRAANNPEQITALGQYMFVHEAKENFSKDDLREAYRRAREVIPKNLPRDVGTAINSAWIHEVPGKAGRYYVTNTGMQQVETKFGRPK